MTSAKLRMTAILCGAVLLTTTAAPAAVQNLYTVSAADSVSLTEAAGWFESAYCKWEPVSGADGYNVYVDGTQIDSTLIRQYNGYYRADAVGLKAGSYTMKVVPVIGGAEDASKAAEKQVTVSAYDRSGFGWVNGTSSGAYNEDGTLRSGAVVLYVTEQTKDTVTADIVTSSKGTTTTTTGIQEILNAIKKGYDTRPFCIRVIGNITDPDGIASVGGDLCIDGGSKYTGGMTLEGIGDDALFTGFGVKIKNMSNLEVRNIGVMLCDSEEGDNITLQQGNDHIWVHNCDSFYGLAGSDADQAKGDGALDCKLSTYVTFSYNHFWDNGKCNLLGLKENTTDDLYITYHHNWYDHSDSRHPRVRFYTAHVYNNYYDGNAKYGIGSTQSSSIFAESNYFRNCKYPILTSMQGSDILTGGTFSSEDGGVVKAYGNIMIGEKSFIPYSEDNSSYDAYVVENKSDQVPPTVTALQTSKLGSSYSHTYNNFDTAADMYSYKADAAADVPAIVEANAGRMNGGDFSYEFDDAVDDADYAVNEKLMSALKSYKSGLVSVGSGSYVTPTEPPTTTEPEVTTTASTASSESGSSATETVPTGSVPTDPASDYIHNFTENGLNSTYFTISGNLSTSKGEMEYNGLTLTQCLKMESATEISFTTTESTTLTLIIKDGTTIKIDGAEQDIPTTGIFTMTLDAGTHTITKGSGSSNLFYMAVSSNGTASTAPASTTTTTVTSTETVTTETTATPAASLLGDVDCNGERSISDAILLSRLSAEDSTVIVSDEGRLNANCNGDDTIDVADVILLLQWLAGIA